MFNRRVWLNGDNSASTGSLCLWHGEVHWRSKDAPELTSYVEFGDCHNKIRLHKTYADSMPDFIAKVDLIIKNLVAYSDYLKTLPKQQTPA